MLIGWGLFGWTAFLMKRFVNNDMSRKLALMAAQGNSIVGLALIGLSAWKTASRDKCSSGSYFQCWYDSSPSDLESWTNTSYAGQSRTSYLLALQMIMLSRGTLKVLDADLKFKKKQEAKEKDASAADADADAAAAPADAASTDAASSDAASSDAKPAATDKPSKQYSGKKYHDQAQAFYTVDGKNGRLVLKNGDVLIIKDGEIVEKNGKPYKKKESRKDEKELEKEQKEREKETKPKEEKKGGWWGL